MKKVLIAIASFLLVFLLTISSAMAEVPSIMVERTLKVIAQMESEYDYGLVEVDTNGKLSIGFVQWNGDEGDALVRRILEASHSSRTFSGSLKKSDKEWVKQLLLTDIGKEIQEDQARKDIKAYIQSGQKLGIEDPTALCYYADILHQVGSGAIVKYHKKACELAGSYSAITLDDLYNAALVYATSTKSRRTKVYQIFKENPVILSPSPNDTDPDAEPAPSSVKPTEADISPSGKKTMYVGDTLTLSAILLPEGSSSSIKWISSNSKVALVENGVVTAVGKGSAKVGFKTGNGLKAYVKITVKTTQIKDLVLSGEKNMQKGTSQTLTASYSPTTCSVNIVWKSTNSKVAKVNAHGVVKAQKPGKATIICKDTISKKTAKLQIVVSN